MIKSIAIIGSFQKYYEDVVGLISFFTNNGLRVTSPYKSRIDEKRRGFVIFEADDKSLTDIDIQNDTLRKIFLSEAVYVYNPEGYVGKTTCYEIGILMCKRKPLYFFEYPEDLPVPVSKEHVLTPQEFVNEVKKERIKFEQGRDLSDRGISSFKVVFGTVKENIVICGSMSFFNEMKEIKWKIESMGINAVIPEDESELIDKFSAKQFEDFKRKVSQSYLRKIRDNETRAVLVYNQEKNGKKNYIGANTLVEIAMAFTWNRKIFLFDNIYPPLEDELVAWECIPLERDVSKLEKYLREIINDSEKYIQTDMFDTFQN